MKSFKIVVNVISAIAAIVAAFLWYKASVVTIKPAAEVTDGSWQDFQITDEGSNNEPYDVIKTGKEQAKWNKYAAIAASVAAIFQAIGLLIPE
jgi:hypothetical protein